PPALPAHVGQSQRQPLQGVALHPLQQAPRLVQVGVREAHNRYPALSLSLLNIRTVSRLNSTRSLPSRCSLVRMASVTVIMSTPASSACTTLSSSRGLAHRSSILWSAARHKASDARMCGTGSRP